MIGLMEAAALRQTPLKHQCRLSIVEFHSLVAGREPGFRITSWNRITWRRLSYSGAVEYQTRRLIREMGYSERDYRQRPRLSFVR